MPTIDEIVAAIDDRIPMISHEIEQLQAARRALTVGRAAAATPAR